MDVDKILNSLNGKNFTDEEVKEFVEKYNRAPGISRGGGYTGPLLGTYGEARYRGDENINYFDTHFYIN